MHDRPVASSSKPKRDKPSGDKWSNYSTPDQLGFAAEEAPSSYEIEQMVRGRGTKVGKWEEVVAAPTPPLEGEGFVPEEKVEETEEEEAANFKFQHRDKRPLRDVYDEDEVDTGALLGIKLKSKERKVGDVEVKNEAKEEKGEAGFSRGGWGKAAEEDVKEEFKHEATEGAADENSKAVKMEAGEEKKPDLDAAPGTAEPPALFGASMFKKRRPPPSSRKK